MGATERRCRGCQDGAGRHLLPGGDDDDVVVLCQVRCSVGTEQEHRQGATVSARFEPMKPAPPVTM